MVCSREAAGFFLLAGRSCRMRRQGATRAPTVKTLGHSRALEAAGIQFVRNNRRDSSMRQRMSLIP